MKLSLVCDCKLLLFQPFSVYDRHVVETKLLELGLLLVCICVTGWILNKKPNSIAEKVDRTELSQLAVHHADGGDSRRGGNFGN